MSAGGREPRRLSPPASAPRPRAGGRVNAFARHGAGRAARGLLHGNACFIRRSPIFLAAGASSVTGIVYWIPFPRPFGSRRE